MANFDITGINCEFKYKLAFDQFSTFAHPLREVSNREYLDWLRDDNKNPTIVAKIKAKYPSDFYLHYSAKRVKRTRFKCYNATYPYHDDRRPQVYNLSDDLYQAYYYYNGGKYAIRRALDGDTTKFTRSPYTDDAHIEAKGIMIGKYSKSDIGSRSSAIFESTTWSRTNVANLNAVLYPSILDMADVSVGYTGARLAAPTASGGYIRRYLNTAGGFVTNEKLTTSLWMERHVDSSETEVGLYNNSDGVFLCRVRYNWVTKTTTLQQASQSTVLSYGHEKIMDIGPNGGEVVRLDFSVQVLSTNAGNQRYIYVYPGGTASADPVYLHFIQCCPEPHIQRMDPTADTSISDLNADVFHFKGAPDPTKPFSTYFRFYSCTHGAASETNPRVLSFGDIANERIAIYMFGSNEFRAYYSNGSYQRTSSAVIAACVPGDLVECYLVYFGDGRLRLSVRVNRGEISTGNITDIPASLITSFTTEKITIGSEGNVVNNSATADSCLIMNKLTVLACSLLPFANDGSDEKEIMDFFYDAEFDEEIYISNQALKRKGEGLDNLEVDALLFDDVVLNYDLNNVTVGNMRVVKTDTNFLWPDLKWQNQPIEIFHGDASWGFNSFRTIYRGRIDNFVSSSDSDYFTLKISNNFNSIEEEIGSEANPLVFGSARNIKPYLFDSGLYKYRLHDDTIANGSIVEIRDSGLALTITTDYTVSGSEITLTSSPAGQITADIDLDDRVSDSFPITNYIVRNLVHIFDDYLQTPIDKEALLRWTLPIDSVLYNLRISGFGYFVSEPTEVKTILDEVLPSYIGGYRFNNLGVVEIYQIVPPENNVISLVIYADDIEVNGIQYVNTENPITTLRIKYLKNWFVQSVDSMAGAVPLYLKEEYSKEFVLTAEASQTLSGYQNQSVEKEVLLNNTSQVENLRDFMLDMESKHRKVYTVKTFLRNPKVGIGNTIQIFYPDFGFDSGVLALVIGKKESMIEGRTTFTVRI